MKLSNIFRFLSIALLAGILTVSGGIPVLAKTKGEESAKTGDPEKSEKGEAEVQRTPAGAFESIRNRVSNLEFFSTNYGILFLDVQSSRAGGWYPRGSRRAYLFGGGVWFGAEKRVLQDGDDPNSPMVLRRMSVISYNPNSGASWMVPGEITQPYTTSVLDQGPEAVNKYRLYFSTDYNSFTGEPFDQIDKQNGGPNWPIWDTDPDKTMLRDRYVGNYVSNLNNRNRSTFEKGPAIVSGEDIISIFKDTDLSRYEIGESRARNLGYPLGIEFDQRIYSWGFGQYQNFIFIRYSMVNKSNDTLFNCYTAPALDTDIGPTANNDHAATAIPEVRDDSLDLGLQWSDATGGDAGYGYMGADFLESPAVDANGFIRHDKAVFENSEQLGLHALRNWVIDIDPRTPEDRYAFMADEIRDVDNGGGDKRFLMSTGPFNMLPGDTARVVVGILIAPSKRSDPDGTWEDLDSLITLDLFAQRVYDENFLAPKPPDPANVSWRPLDNGVELSWDTRSELSLDMVERGLDFAGYIIQRSRKAAGSDVIAYDSVVGYNLGYKTIATIPIPPLPTDIQRIIAARSQNLSVLGPWYRLPMLADTGTVTFTLPNGGTGSTGFAIIPANCVDTIKRPGLADSLVVRPGGNRFDTVSSFSPPAPGVFDPFDDENNDITLYNDISNRWWNANGQFDGKFTDKPIRDIVREAIVEIMDSVTNGRTFIDVGDDNGDGQIVSNPDNLISNEKLINNIDYYYQVLAYDQGSVEDNTPSKVNSGIAGINEVRATPEAPPAGLPIVPEITEQRGLGGIGNFNLITYDGDRLGQLFGGDTLTFEFQPYSLWDPDRNVFFNPYWYTSEVIVRSAKLGELNRFVVPYVRGDILRPVFTDRANDQFRNIDSAFISRWTYSRHDTTFMRDGEQIDSTVIDSMYVDNRDVRETYRNTFITEPGRFYFNTNGVTKSTFGISFDWTGVQYGDSLRFGKFVADSNQLPDRDGSILGTPDNPGPSYPFEVDGGSDVNLVDGPIAYGTVSQTQNPLAIPSIGQVVLEVEFVEGGNERLEWTNGGKTYRIDSDVHYLIPKVRNVATFDKEVRNSDGTTSTEAVQYNYEFPADAEYRIRIDTADATVLTNEDAYIRLVDKGEFGLTAYPWTNIKSMTPAQRRQELQRLGKVPPGRPVGTLNRYYTGEYQATIVEDNKQVDVRFTHRLTANGAITLLDFAGMGSIDAGIPNFSTPEERNRIIPDNFPSTDLKAGDKVRIYFTGGALGLPEPGAFVKVAIPDPTPGEGQFTDDLLDAVHIVPNPYLIDHLGQASTSDKKLYFTRLPEVCTIEIYTAAGELLQTIEHNSATNPDGRVAVEAWGLVTKGNRQAQTQLLVARITTPDGAETVKKFSIVVGGFRLLTQ